MSSLSNHFIDEIQLTNDDLNNNTINLNRTFRLTKFNEVP